MSDIDIGRREEREVWHELDPAEQLGANGLWVGELELETSTCACLEDLGDLPFVTNKEYEWVSMGTPKQRG